MHYENKVFFCTCKSLHLKISVPIFSCRLIFRWPLVQSAMNLHLRVTLWPQTSSVAACSDALKVMSVFPILIWTHAINLWVIRPDSRPSNLDIFRHFFDWTTCFLDRLISLFVLQSWSNSLAVPLWRQWDTRGAEAHWAVCEVSLVQHELPAIEDDRVTVVCHQTLCAFVCLCVCVWLLCVQ